MELCLVITCFHWSIVLKYQVRVKAPGLSGALREYRRGKNIASRKEVKSHRKQESERRSVVSDSLQPREL